MGRTFTAEEVAALVTKLDAMDFTDDERAILRAVFEAAVGESEVEGFAFDPGSLPTVGLGLGLSTPKPQKTDGSLEAPVRSGYDLKANKGA